MTHVLGESGRRAKDRVGADRHRAGALTAMPRWASVSTQTAKAAVIRMHRTGRIVTVAAIGAMVFALAPTDDARAQSTSGQAATRSGATEFSSQSQPQPRRVRPRTRVRVSPIYPYRTFSTDYPVPYEYEYPGPNGVRQCKSRLVQEMRPSGAVVVPRMRCWWEVQ